MPVVFVYCPGRCHELGGARPSGDPAYRESVAIVVAINEAVLLETRHETESRPCIVPYEVGANRDRSCRALFAIVCQIYEHNEARVVRFAKRIGVLLEKPASVMAPLPAYAEALRAQRLGGHGPALSRVHYYSAFDLLPTPAVFKPHQRARLHHRGGLRAVLSRERDARKVAWRVKQPVFLARNVATIDPYNVASDGGNYDFEVYGANRGRQGRLLLHTCRIQNRINVAKCRSRPSGRGARKV